MDLDVRLDELIGMNDTLIALVGESGSGKTAIANYLKDIYGLRILRSYTTRQKRADSNDDHCYISVEEYSKLDNKLENILQCLGLFVLNWPVFSFFAFILKK